MTDPTSQPELALSYPLAAGAEIPLLPARMVNEFVYCPRLAYLEWVQGEWAESADTTEGRFAHRRTDSPRGAMPEAEELDAATRIHARSITLAFDTLGVIAKLDLVEGEDGAVRPVDTKRGRRPYIERSAYLPERVQVGLQILLLREHGYACDEGILHFAESRERVPVVLDEDLHAEVLKAVHGLRLMAASSHIPPPLEDNPKCPRCSLVGICLPDEVSWLRAGRAEPRPLAVARAEALPMVVQEPRARIGKDGDTLEVSVEGAKVATARLAEVSQLVVYGNAYLTTPALHELMRREIPVSWHSHGGWFMGHTMGLGHRNVEIRAPCAGRTHHRSSAAIGARGLVAAKIRNGRTLQRRNWRGEAPSDALLAALDRDRQEAETARDQAALLGIEGIAARRYFEGFSACIAPGMLGEGRFDWPGRNRRPPTNPVNALLSFVYAMLTRAWTIQLSAVGLDAYRGFYRQPRYGRPARHHRHLRAAAGPGDHASAVRLPGGLSTAVRSAGAIARALPGRRDSRHAPHHAAIGGSMRVGDQLWNVTYDVGDQKRWRRVFRIMKGRGEWLQLSVFQCRLSRRGMVELRAALAEVVNNNQDHVLFLDLGPADEVKPRVSSLGKAFEAVERRPVIV
ncbi:CRISPR-associated endonuclease Cas4g/Cas1g [Neoroseomonas eburnea]|nr:CRISPR-associated endonuclease Cas1 [Neoroseomonas eburnea]